jgi:predicted transcriptional regulator
MRGLCRATAKRVGGTAPSRFRRRIWRERMTSYTVQIEKKLAERLEQAAHTAKISSADLIAECIAQHLDITIRHLALVERLEAVDQGLLELATFVGEATAGGNVDVSGLCRYAPPKV